MRTFTLIMLLTLASFVRADDPEPPSGVLQRLQGKWVADRAISKGQEKKVQNASYTFRKNQVVYTYGSGKPQPMTAKAVQGQRDVFELVPEKGKTTRWFFKIEKGELHLVPVRSDDPKAKPDFSSQSIGVLILKSEKT